jgi:hypothetical protein
VGGAFIGFLRKESGELLFKAIPLELFQGSNWKEKKPYDFVVELIKEGLKELKFDKDDEKILICRGNIFDQARTYFNERGINHEPAIIDGKLQDAVEGKLIDHLRNLGVKSKSLNKNSGAKRFFVLLDWVSRDFYNREKFVKNGFKKWNTVWRKKAIEKYEKYKKSKLRHRRKTKNQKSR